MGDGRVNRVPDVVVLRPEHIEILLETKKSTLLLGMPAPAFVAEVVSPGSENSDNYRRDYEWQRQQYEALEIPEYWIIDRHRQQVKVLTLKDGLYSELVYRGDALVQSDAFPQLTLSAAKVLAGGI